jgi:hypothetical protein
MSAEDLAALLAYVSRQGDPDNLPEIFLELLRRVTQ